ncbi:hypothetical protein BPAE_0044g00080 [Botrytis paeoniae]|uniref:BTB domain-containing protein n=1 Tax=Botrytis paeoniae TaxID=278948 RepID=A0A4Z1FRY5_9HELO|nr:hypothetical protein BPAE_0044g00080 [Botrytis paeoniae]
MASDTLEVPEKLIFDAKGDFLLIFTQESKSDAETESSSSESGSRKRKCPDDDSKTVTMLVSSNQMILTSPVFEAMLDDDRFKEGADLLADGQVEVDLPEDDPIAFAIIANVIHHRNKLVPEQLTLKLLTEVAILTEKYQMYEAMRWVSKQWIQEVAPNATDPKGYKFKDVNAIMFISLVFDDAFTFEWTTKEAIWRSKEEFGANIMDHCYFPTSVIAAINSARAQVFSDVFAALNSFLERETEVQSYCDDPSDVCGIMTAGSFLKSMAVNGCWPFRPEPYENTNLKRLFRGISKIEIQTKCLVRKKAGNSGFLTTVGFAMECKNRQMFKKMIDVQIKAIKSKIVGLDIQQFRYKPKLLAWEGDDFTEPEPRVVVALE